MSDIKPANRERLKSGIWDKAWNPKDPGIVKTSTTLLSGDPGAGKSTLLSQVSAGLAELGLHTLYAVREEGGEDLRSRAEWLEHTGMEWVNILEVETADDLAIGLESKPDFIILDSLSALVGDDYQSAISVLSELKRYAKRHRVPSVITSHVTKEDPFAGRVGLQHFVDVTMTMQTFPEGPARRLFVEKNRFGPSKIGVDLIMTEYGLADNDATVSS